MIRPGNAWLARLIVGLVFSSWYTSFKGPLTPEEVATVMQFAEASDASPNETPNRQRRQLQLQAAAA